MTEVITEFQCKTCYKYYSSYQSLWIHNKKFHNNNVNIGNINGNNTVNNGNNIVNNVNNERMSENKYICNVCKKIFSCRQSKYVHQKTICKKDLNDNQELLKSNDKLEKEIIDIKNILKELLEKNCKIHPKTLQKINKQLINNTNTNNTNNGTINNGPVINNTYVKFGNEQLASLLSHKDMLKIINKQCLCIEESIIKKIKDFFNN
jgi:hypothetical protein